MEAKEMFYSYCTERNQNGFAPVTVVIPEILLLCYLSRYVFFGKKLL